MNRMQRIALGLMLFGAGACGSGAASKTNLLLITLDTTRADRLGAYGYEGGRTPNLDGLSFAGVTFEQAYSPAPMTLPAHATMLTGVLPPEHGARVNGVHKLAAEVPTMGEWLGEKGYRRGAFVAAFVLDKRFGLDRGFDHYDDDLSQAYVQETPEGLSTYRPGKLVVDAALDWLKSGEGPFFAWVHLYDAHFPWHPHGDGVQDPDSETGTYDGEVSYMDAQVGRLLQYLDDNGLRSKTVVMAVADHGEGLGDHHEIEHAYLLNEEVLRIPWFVSGPGVKPGHRVQSLVSLEDLQPTALELLGLQSTGARGRSLVRALAGEGIESGESYAETELPWTGYRWAPQYSLTTEEWKYVRTPQTELYSRASDRRELANLASAKPHVVLELEARLLALEASFILRESELAQLSADENEQLAALGYATGSVDELPEDGAGLADVKERLPAKDLSANLRRGIASDALGAEERVQIALRLIEMSPETPSFHNQLAEAYVERGDFASALPVFEKVVEMVPTDAGAHYAMGDALQQLGRTAEARKHLELALSMSPDMAAAHVGMGNVLRSEGRADLAAGEYTEALRLRPIYPEAFYNLAQSFMDRNMPKEALLNFSSALEHRPGWGLVHVRLANLHMSLGEPVEARPHFEAALEEFSDDVDLNNDYGVALEQLGLPNEARDQYLKAMELNPDYFRPHVNLGNLAFAHGNDAIALEQYEAGLALAPGQPETSARLARFLATHPEPAYRQPQRALALASRAVDLSGGTSASILDTLAAAQASTGDFPGAMTSAARAQKRAELQGDASFAEEVQARWALYALNKPYVLQRAPREQAPGGQLGTQDSD